MALLIKRKLLLFLFIGFILTACFYGIIKYDVANDKQTMYNDDIAENEEKSLQESEAGQIVDNSADINNNTDVLTDIAPIPAAEQKVIKSADYFEQYRLNRKIIIEQQFEVLREIIDNPNTDEQLRMQTQTELLQLSKQSRNEAELENMLQIRGYPKSLVIINEESISIIISESISAEQKEEISAFVQAATEINIGMINIMDLDK